MQVFGTEGYACIDLTNSKVTTIKVPRWLRNRHYDLLDTTPAQQAFIRENLFDRILPKTELDIQPANAILSEQKDWVRAIRNGEVPRVTIEAGMQAVEIAQSVLDSIATHRWQAHDVTTTGPLGVIQAPVVPFEVLLNSRRNAA